MNNFRIAKNVLNLNTKHINHIMMGENSDAEEIQKSVEEQIQEAVSAAREEAQIETQGLKASQQSLLEEKKKIEKSLKKFEGVDLEGLQALQKQVENDEVLRLHAEGKHNEAYEKMQEGERLTFNATKEALESQIKDLKEGNESNILLIDKLLIGGGAKSAFTKANGLPSATDTVELLAKEIWKVENGIPVARNEKGEMMQGAEGALTMQEWTEDLKKSHSYLFPQSETGGANGGDGTNGGLKSIEQQIIEAANSGKHDEVRRLRKERDKK